MEGLKILLATWIVLVITMMCETYYIWMAWLIPHLIENNSASVDIILTVWWSIFFKGLLKEWI